MSFVAKLLCYNHFFYNYLFEMIRKIIFTINFSEFLHKVTINSSSERPCFWCSLLSTQTLLIHVYANWSMCTVLWYPQCRYQSTAHMDKFAYIGQCVWCFGIHNVDSKAPYTWTNSHISVYVYGALVSTV